jgi:hypothetical protein
MSSRMPMIAGEEYVFWSKIAVAPLISCEVCETVSFSLSS